MIEDMAHRNARCRSRLACLIRLSTSLFDDATALRYLGVCAGGIPDRQTADNMGMALARLSEKSPCAAAKTVVDCTFDDRCSGGGVAYALDMIARACPDRLMTAILDKAAASPAPCPCSYLASVVKRVALRADSEAILGPLFGALDAGGAACRPALCMIRAMVDYNHSETHDSELASRTLDRLVSHARASGIDVDSIRKAESDPCLRSAAIINRLLNPSPEIDAERVLQNLELLPALKRSFDPALLVNAAREGRMPHLLAAWLSRHSTKDLKRLLAGPSGETTCERRIRELRLGCERGPAKALAFLDRALALLEDSRLVAATYVKHMKNPGQFRDTVSEIALVVPFVAGGCKVELEPGMGQKRLDAAITLGSQRVLVEVFSPRMWPPLELFGGPRKVSRDRLAGKILAKAVEQLPDPGTCGDPIVVAVDISRSEMTSEDAEKCMHNRNPRTGSISAVACFEPAMSCDLSASARGTVIPNPLASVPLEVATLRALKQILQGAPPGKEHAGGGVP